MWFNPEKRVSNSQDPICRKKQCNACPLKIDKNFTDPEKHPQTDILILSEKLDYEPIDKVASFKTTVAFMTECAVPGVEAPETAKSCCLGRKLDLLTQTKPKVVICIGYDAFKAIDTACGNHPEGNCDGFMYPTDYKGHKFHMFMIPPWEVRANINNELELIEAAVKNPPICEKGNYDGVELVTRNSEIDAAFDWLELQDYVSIDIETVNLRPYDDKNVILSVALGTEERVYAFPLFHPQTPGDFDVEKVLRRLRCLKRRREYRGRFIAHNAPFEMERLQHLFDMLFDDCGRWIYETDWEDTQAQCYVMTMPGKRSKKLNACIRRYFGFDLKSMSNLDVTNLINTPLEQVLTYNALDVKYTHKLFFVQAEDVVLMEVEDSYLRQIREAKAAVIMQLEGLQSNNEFTLPEIEIWQPQKTEALARWYTFPQVKATAAKHGKCEPGSPDDLKFLFHEQFNVPATVQSFDAKFLNNFKHPIVETILSYRKAAHMLSTYLIPYAVGYPGGGANVWPDGKVHPQFNTMLTDTGRWSCSDPNGQNFPSRDGKKYLRNTIRAALGDDYRMLSIDMAQIEYRVAASLTNCPVMLKGLLEDFDVHMHWAQEVLKLFPHLLKERDKKSMKGFRSSMKSAVVFALIYGAGAKRVSESLGVENEINKVYRLMDKFWDMHGAIKEWQTDQKWQHDNIGYIKNALGRKYFAQLNYNQICNYPIQGTASDMLIEALCALVQMQVLEGAPWKLVLNIHDDLTFVVHKDKVDDALALIIPIMLKTKCYSEWLKVPLGVEASIGTTWGGQEEIGTFTSLEIGT